MEVPGLGIESELQLQCQILNLLHHSGNSSGGILELPLHFFFFVFLRLHLRHMEVPRLGVKSELAPSAYATTTAMQDLSCAWQHRILNPLSEAGDQTHNLMVPSRICFRCATMGTPRTLESGVPKQPV